MAEQQKAPEKPKTDPVNEFLKKHDNVYTIGQIKASQGILLFYGHRNTTDVYVTGDSLDWQRGWIYQDFRDGHAEKTFEFTPKEKEAIKQLDLPNQDTPLNVADEGVPDVPR